MEKSGGYQSEEVKGHLLLQGNERVYFSYGRTVTYTGHQYNTWRFDLGVSRDIKPGEDRDEVIENLIIENVERVDGMCDDTGESLKGKK